MKFFVITNKRSPFVKSKINQKSCVANKVWVMIFMFNVKRILLLKRDIHSFRKLWFDKSSKIQKHQQQNLHMCQIVIDRNVGI